MKKIKTYSLLIIFAFIISGISMTSCEPNEPPKAVVTVFELTPMGEELPVANCEVRLDPPSGTTQPELLEYMNKVKLTDFYGQVEYDFAYEGVITIIVEKEIDDVVRRGHGVLILKNNEIYEESIRLVK